MYTFIYFFARPSNMRNRFSGGRTRGAEETQCVDFSWCERSSISSWCLIWIFKLDGEISEHMVTLPPILDSQEARTIWRRIGHGVTIRANDVMRGISAGGCLQSRRVSEVARKQTGKREVQRKIQCQSKGNCHPSGGGNYFETRQVKLKWIKAQDDCFSTSM